YPRANYIVDELNIKKPPAGEGSYGSGLSTASSGYGGAGQKAMPSLDRSRLPSGYSGSTILSRTDANYGHSLNGSKLKLGSQYGSGNIGIYRPGEPLPAGMVGEGGKIHALSPEKGQIMGQLTNLSERGGITGPGAKKRMETGATAAATVGFGAAAGLTGSGLILMGPLMGEGLIGYGQCIKDSLTLTPYSPREIIPMETYLELGNLAEKIAPIGAAVGAALTLPGAVRTVREGLPQARQLDRDTHFNRLEAAEGKLENLIAGLKGLPQDQKYDPLRREAANHLAIFAKGDSNQFPQIKEDGKGGYKLTHEKVRL
ncbi:MAG: hypothetical protein JW727_04310, partial [Candidatus Aenigmarchaeota archaeon]|nr:hypothetical protein [Candidatus Aenigmarchaeota archaeon]